MSKKRKRKGVNVKKVLLICGITIIAILLIGNSISKSKKPTEWKPYTVQSGDTVCDIAQSITSDDEDYRKTQYYIIEENNIEGEMIYPGQTILIPDEEKTEVKTKDTIKVTDTTDEEETLKSLGTFQLTAYCPCVKCCGKSNRITASGIKAVQGVTIATDKSIPFDTKVYIEGIGERIVQDRGGAIKGNKIDIYFDSHTDALNFGVQYKEVFVN